MTISMTMPQARRRRCTVDGAEVRLSPTQARILEHLLIMRGRPVSVTDMIEVAYPDPDDSPDEEIAVLKIHVHNLRKKIGWGIINTRHGFGWEIAR